MQRVDRLRARSHQTLDVLCDREIILYAYAQHFQTTAARYSRQRCRFGSGCSMVSPSPAVSEDDTEIVERPGLPPLMDVIILSNGSKACLVIYIITT